MNQDKKLFRDQLIESESMNPNLKEKYEKELKNMLEKKLNLTMKISYTLSGILSLVMGVFFSYIAIVTAKGLPNLIRFSFGFGAIMAFLWTGMMVWILKRGRLNLRRDSKMSAGWVWGVVVVNMTVLLLVSGQNPNSTLSVFMAVSGLVFLVIGAVFLIAEKINQSELNTKEQILLMKLQMAEILDELHRHNSSSKTDSQQ